MQQKYIDGKLSNLNLNKLLVCTLVPFLEHFSELSFLCADNFVIELEYRHNLVPSNDNHFICLLSFLNLNVPERYLFDESFFLELFNVL